MRCAAALALLALLGGALAACGPDVPDVPDADAPARPSCTLLADKHRDSLARRGARGVAVRGRGARVTLLWGAAPPRAAAALLLVLLRDVLHYRGLRSARAPHDLAALAAWVPFDPSAQYTELVIGVSAAWRPRRAPAWAPLSGARAGLAGPRLGALGASGVAARRRLHAWMAPGARRLAACARLAHWAALADATVRALCGFHDAGAALQRNNESAVELLGVGECDATLQELQARARAAALPLRARSLPRALLLRRQRDHGDRSFLFLDYDMWQGEPGVSVVEPPPCLPDHSACQPELDTAIAMRVADVDILQTYAPQLLDFVHNDFDPSPKSLRLILEQEANGVDIEEAACEWAFNQTYVIGRNVLKKHNRYKYTVAIYLCDDDPDIESYDNITRIISSQIVKETNELGYVIALPRYLINCSDAYNMSLRLEHLTQYVGFRKVLGVVTQAVAGAELAAAAAAAHRVPLLLLDVAPEAAGAAGRGATGPGAAAWRPARVAHVAPALRRFVRAAGWARVAVLSQPGALAQHYYSALKEDAQLLLHEYPIQLNLTESQAKEVLHELQIMNARIVFINADSRAAVVMLTAALECRMSYADGFVWIVRDWRPNNATSNTTHFTVSPWGRGEEGLPPADGRPLVRSAITTSLRGRMWPPLGAALADALLTLDGGFRNVFRRCPQQRYDLHTAHVIRSFNESIIETPIIGVSQLLQYKDGWVEETFVYVDEWRGATFRRLATWRVNASSGAVRGAPPLRAALPADDGASRCVARAGDAFQPRCYDAAWGCALLLLALLGGALLLLRRAWRRRLARVAREQRLELMARRRHVAAALAACLVERGALELRHELGAGRFGSVRLGVLRQPPRAPRYVAAKALRAHAAPADESEFLREACTIASLQHAHVVRLVGVCVADGPPLVLMELAFFGDLLGYLRARRHLAGGAAEEAAHVAGAALTRLAREAALALQYLAARGVVHRDVRAANCLLDARRSLKLADFGMARHAVGGADGAPEYACRRRGLFPVLWMAPESLAHGVFSAASDVWALGVLVLELVTLGARPYGSMSPLRVLEHVAAGGCPPLPPDATPQTRGLARLCWQRAAERRPGAAELAAYLQARPLALQPALLSERDEPADADSGFGESPSTELLPPETPFHSLDQLEVLAATH